MEYPEQLNNFCNYMSHLNRSVLTIEQYRTDLTMFFQYLRAGRISKVPTKEELDRQPIADFSVEELRPLPGRMCSVSCAMFRKSGATSRRQEQESFRPSSPSSSIWFM